MPLVQQQQTGTPPTLRDMIFGPESERWTPRDRAADAPAAETVPIVEPTPVAQPTTERKTRTRRQRAVGMSMYELLGQTLALLGTLALAGLIWAIGAYFTLRFLDDWNAQAKLGVLLAAFGMTPSSLMLYWMTRSVPVIMTVIEAFFLPRWNWPWTPAAEQVTPSGAYRWLIFGTVLTPDVYTTAAGLTTWVMDVLGLAAGWSVVAAVVLGITIAISPEKIGRKALVELKALWQPPITQAWQRITQR